VFVTAVGLFVYLVVWILMKNKSILFLIFFVFSLWAYYYGADINYEEDLAMENTDFDLDLDLDLD
jgi:hypothetical protein